jgi:uncharacterized protein (DUF1499 family)
MDSETIKPRWWAQAILIGSIIAAVLLIISGVGTRFGIWEYTGGFTVASGGVLLASAAVFLGIVGYAVCLFKGFKAERASLLVGVLISALILGQAAMQMAALAAVPAIHNISTDTLDPPDFDTLVAVRQAEGANPLAYDAEVLADVQQQAYPWVKTLSLSDSPAIALNNAVTVLNDMGLEVVNVSVDLGIVEATDTTFWYGFKDDVVVRIRNADTGSGSIVDVRSVSRVGRSDLGLNAKRIGEVLSGLGG